MPAPGISFGVGLRMAKRGFFNPEVVMKGVEAAERRAMGHFGGYVRKTAIRSMRHRRAYSPPGEPPSRHVGLIGRLTFYSYDHARGSVVVGPVLARGRRQGTMTVPELLEHGGRVRRKVTMGLLRSLYEARRHTPRAAAQFKALRPKLNQRVTMRYEPRPFMAPAFEAAKADLEPFWKDSVRA